MQLNESRRPALFPSRKCYINVRKRDKNTHPLKGTRSGKQLFFRIRLFSPNRMLRLAMLNPISCFERGGGGFIVGTMIAHDE